MNPFPTTIMVYITLIVNFDLSSDTLSWGKNLENNSSEKL